MKELFELFYKSSGVSTDTRKIKTNCLFIALKGDNFNGNTFSKQAINKGAAYAIVDEKEFADNKQIFLVNDTQLFLQELARHHRKKINKPVIGITGTKENIYNEPDGFFLPPAKPRLHELYYKKGAEKAGVKVIPSRLSILTKRISNE